MTRMKSLAHYDRKGDCILAKRRRMKRKKTRLKYLYRCKKLASGKWSLQRKIKR